MALHDLLPIDSEDVKAVASGNWFSTSTWSTGQVPTTGQNVRIPSGFAVTYNGTSNTRLNVVRVDGKLSFKQDTNTKLIVDSLICMANSELIIGTASSPIQASKTARIIIASPSGFNSNDPDATAIDTSWDWHQLSRGVVAHGTTQIYGAQKTVWKQLNGAVNAGSSTVTLSSAPSSWSVGDQVVITGTKHHRSTWYSSLGTALWNGTEDEERTITAINGATVTLNAPLDYTHEDLGADIKGRPMRAYIANYSRNIIFETEGGATIPTQQRGHVMFMHSADVVVKHAAFNHLGRTDKTPGPG